MDVSQGSVALRHKRSQVRQLIAFMMAEEGEIEIRHRGEKASIRPLRFVQGAYMAKAEYIALNRDGEEQRFSINDTEPV